MLPYWIGRLWKIFRLKNNVTPTVVASLFSSKFIVFIALQSVTTSIVTTGPSSRLHVLAKELLSDNDPEKIVVRTEVRSSFVKAMIDELLHSGVSFRQFRPVLDIKINFIRDTGHPDLARAIIDDLDCLEHELQLLRELQDAGASSFIAAELDARLQSWRDARVLTVLEVQRFGKCSAHDGLVLCGDFNDTPNSIIYAGITNGWLSLAKYKNIVSTPSYALDFARWPRRTRLRIMSGLCLASQMLRLIEAQWNRSIPGAIDLGLQITALITYFSPGMQIAL